MSQSPVAPSRITIIGAGLIGRSWATVLARAGHAVTEYDPDAHNREAADTALAGQARVVATLATAVADADYMQENAPERLDLKRALFAELDCDAPPTAILASSSSALTCSAICDGLAGKDRCIIAHLANPPHLMRAVEVAPAPVTSPDTVARTTALLGQIEQVPVTIGEIDGFVMNRLQAALVGEALRLVEAGIADGPAIDAIVKHSLGRRWSFVGPFETMDLNAPAGFSDYADRYGDGFSAMLGGDGWPKPAVRSVDAARRDALPLGDMSARRIWRDARLAELRALFDTPQ